jgi:hypothetical protein
VRRIVVVALLAAGVLALVVAAGRSRERFDPWLVDSPRNDALSRAQVLRPASDAPLAALGTNPSDMSSFGSDVKVACRYQPTEASGTTPKFDCALDSGEIVKVKYGRNPELAAEVAATRLLQAAGFGADRMYLVQNVTCYGCPPNPFRIQQAADLVRGHQLLTSAIDYSRSHGFAWATVERDFDAPPITANGAKGWAWWELDHVDAARGGASRAELDAFRLMAVFLAHWDNKSENQRLVCLSGESDGRRCRRPFALIQDAGATFGPHKVDLAGWRAARIWADASCRVSMKDLPHRGGTFGDVSISEGGRRLLASRLSRLTEAHVRDLIAAARFAEFDGSEAEPGEIAEWVDVFMRRVREITERAPCPE